MFNILLGFSKYTSRCTTAMVNTELAMVLRHCFDTLQTAGLKGSTALSQAVVTGGALAGFMYSSSKRHPDDHEQSLIDFDLALILTPMLLLGVTAGKACCKTSPLYMLMWSAACLVI